jgi:hypothetical protein
MQKMPTGLPLKLAKKHLHDRQLRGTSAKLMAAISFAFLFNVRPWHRQAACSN